MGVLKNSKPFKEDNVKAFDEIYHQYSDAVYRNVSKIVRQPVLAEEILQDVFFALWENWDQIDIDNSVGGWLMVVSQNKAISCIRKMVREKVIAQAEIPEIIDEQDETSEDLEIKLNLLYNAIEQLPPRRKEVFTLCKLEGKSYQEASEMMGISVYTVKEHLIAATKVLKEYIQVHGAKNAAWLLYILTHLGK
ncbi:sigma-70 family RNA polymerase sigma factor [Dyadobacter chenwenxiniae]|uniref:Sigma-70 family RNA polymerase sigma factor n=1 Tax=Dyadobacter chenwenxiniae TaxID=2906456 RepID=A0A9X1PQS1_9BACT|nr:sigma-70 family RNA polymerase sigma factor [Dyadobacter chenwenxiniae]MCF0063201.1 sigma-70 family RNA polymerase sigma factor [Dyadobacter chenwenxiniae]UON85419.1 sigma-70 family RNA polymerase sigma factor [Dyadobacter chenwenxiniae]